MIELLAVYFSLVAKIAIAVESVLGGWAAFFVIVLGVAIPGAIPTALVMMIFPPASRRTKGRRQ